MAWTSRLLLLVPLLVAAPAVAQDAPELIWSVDGALAKTDPVDEERLYDEHRLRLEAGKRYRIGVRSDDFDTLLRLHRAGEAEPIAENDDAGGETHSTLTYAPTTTGEYRIRIFSFAPDGLGAYAARAALIPPLPAPNRARPSLEAAGRWQIWDGRLDEGDADLNGQYFDDYQISMAAGESRLIMVDASDFDPIVHLVSVNAREGEPLDSNDDGGPGLGALLGVYADTAGDYLVRVISYGDGKGAYRLRISDPIIPPPPAPAAAPSEASGD